MIRVCSGNNAATAGTNYLLGVATKFGKVSLGWLEVTASREPLQTDRTHSVPVSRVFFLSRGSQLVGPSSRSWNHGLHLIRVGALDAASVDGRGDVIVGLT